MGRSAIGSANPNRSINRRKGRNRYNVAFYVPRIGPLLSAGERAPAGGAETQIFLVARELARRGSNVRLIVFDLPGSDLPSSIDEVTVTVRPPYRTHEPLGKLREAVSIGRAVADANADVVVSRVAGPEVGLVALFAKLCGRRFIYSSANVSDFDLARVEPTRRNRRLFQLGIRLADDIVVQTAEQVALCQERFGRSPTLIESIAESAHQRNTDPEAFVWIGRVVSYKQPVAFVDLARSLPDARFWMVAVPSPDARGGSELMTALERIAAPVPNLELLSPRPRRELMDLVDRAVAVVNTADHEGMPNVFLEGWARGVPALALTHDPDGVIDRHGLGAFAHGSPERFVELARGLWEMRGSQAAIAQRCREYVREHHSPEIVSACWQEVLGLVPRPCVTEETALAQ